MSLVALHRAAQRQYGRELYSLEVLCPSSRTADAFLPEGVLERITRHVVGIGEQRGLLLEAGQHLKRGVLLYGLLNQATKLARANQPAIVVLEDCDLVAEERGGDTNAVLFETLEALDGLDGDADITFILTTNRPDLLERALVERPGRVDLAVRIDKPDRWARRQLLGLYAADLGFSEAALTAAADRSDGTTASFAKELARRCVLSAAQLGRPPVDDDLAAALEEMLSESEAFTRTLLGGGSLTYEEEAGFDPLD